MEEAFANIEYIILMHSSHKEENKAKHKCSSSYRLTNVFSPNGEVQSQARGIPRQGTKRGINESTL